MISKKHNVQALSVDELEILSAPFEVVRYWIENYVEFNKIFLKYVGKQIRQSSNLASDLALYDTGTRLVKLFLNHIVHDDHHPRLRLIHDFTNEELASMIGSVRVVVNRYMQKLKNEGILVAKRSSLEIIDMHALLEKLEQKICMKSRDKSDAN